MSGPASALPGMDPVAPIAIGLVVGVGFVAALVVFVIARRRSSEQEPLKAADSDTGAQPSVDASGRDRNLPRWLDPSLAAARLKTAATTTPRPAAAAAIAPARVPMVFLTPAGELAERLRVRYDGVPLLDRPDDVLGRMLRELDGGDEVEVLERAEIWAQVRTPNGLIGWIPGMTLSAQWAAAAEDDANQADAIELELQEAADELPALEALLEAVAAQRLTRQEPGPIVEAAPVVEAAPAPPRPRARKPRAAQQPTTEQRATAEQRPTAVQRPTAEQRPTAVQQKPRTPRPRQGSKRTGAEETQT